MWWGSIIYEITSVFSGVRVTLSLVLCVCFVDHCLSFCPFSFGHCVVCSSSIDGFWLPPFGMFNLFLVLQPHCCSKYKFYFQILDTESLKISMKHNVKMETLTHRLFASKVTHVNMSHTWVPLQVTEVTHVNMSHK